MSTSTKIEWTDTSWNPLRASFDSIRPGWHCEKISAGCANCYAERHNGRLLPAGGTGLPYTQRSRGRVRTYLDERVLTAPLRWRKPRRVFVCSMTDLFGEWVTDEQIDRVFAVMALTPECTFQVLTKRAERMRDYVSDSFDPLPNVWLGVSAEDQASADARIPHLLATPAAVRFVSAEPLLGSIDFRILHHEGLTNIDALAGRHGVVLPLRGECARLDWLIVGGESGSGARPCDVAWVRSIVRQCKAASVACFVKQLGSRPCGVLPGAAPDYPAREAGIRHSKGGDPSEWPTDLRVREFPDHRRETRAATS